MIHTPGHSTVGKRVRLALAMILVLSAMAAWPAPAVGAWWRHSGPKLVSATPSGAEGGNDSWGPSISEDGSFVAFTSWAADLSPDDDNDSQGGLDVFLRDVAAGSTEILSAPGEGADAPWRGARDITVSDDGRYVTFYTGCGFVPEDTNGTQDLYRYDTETGTYEWADLSLETQGDTYGNYMDDPRISGDGSCVVFTTDNPLLPEDPVDNYYWDGASSVYLYDFDTDTLELISNPNGSEYYRGSRDGSVSDDGRFVAFYTGLDLVEADTNGEPDLYIYDRGLDTYAQYDCTGGYGSAWSNAWDFQISGEASRVVFTTQDNLDPDDNNGDYSNAKDIYVYDFGTDELIYVSELPEGGTEWDRGSRDGVISDDGDTVAFFSGKDLVADDDNGGQDVYSRDLSTGEFTRVLITEDGSSPHDHVEGLALSGDGEHLAFVWESAGRETRMGAAFYDPSKTGPSIQAVAPTYDDQVFVTSLEAPLAAGGTRLSGLDRYGTAVDISQQAFPNGAATVVIATGANWPDALCASSLGGAVDAPVLLTTPGALPANVKAEITRLGAEHAYIVGGYGAVSASVETELENMLPGYVNRINGVDRYGTSRAVANRVIDILGSAYDGTAMVTTGNNYPDALAGAPLASGLDWPILLANPVSGAYYLPPDTDEAIVLGGTGAIPATMFTAMEGDLGVGQVTRIGGLTRYETGAMIAQFGVDNGLLWNGVGIASGQDYPDALSGGVALGLMRTVVLLTPPATLDSFAAAKLTANNADIDAVHFLGGTGAVSPAVATAVLGLIE